MSFSFFQMYGVQSTDICVHCVGSKSKKVKPTQAPE